MGKPIIHARSSVEHFGGKVEDYLKIHQLIDSSRESFPDLRHRALTHNSWFITKILPLIFGETIKNSERKIVSVVSIAEHHVAEDYSNKFIPSAQDFLEQIEFQPWMDNGKNDDVPSSRRKLQKLTQVPQKQKTSKSDVFKKSLFGKFPDFPKKFSVPEPRRGCGGGSGPSMTFD